MKGITWETKQHSVSSGLDNAVQMGDKVFAIGMTGYNIYNALPKQPPVDTDGDGYPDSSDNCKDISNPLQENLDKDSLGDVCDPDIDGDGMPNDWEIRYGLNQLDASDAAKDNDGDGISNLDEYKKGTDPTQKDDLRPDLQITDAQVPSSMQVGKSVNIPIQVKNAGSSAAAASTLGLWLSSDDVLDESKDTALTTIDIAALTAGQSESKTAVVTISATASGAQYVLLKADSKSVVDETDEINNLVKKQSTITNSPPTANADNVTLDEDTPKTVALAGTDPEGGTLTYTVVDPPKNGKWGIIGNAVTYTPNLNFNGKDSFTFKVNDGNADSAAATVSIQVNAVNDAPTANAGTDQVADSGAKVALAGSGTDVDGDTLTYSWVQTAGTPTVTLSGATTSTPSFTAPQANQDTKLTFTLTVSDGKGGTTTDSVDVTVKAVADTKPDDFNFTERKDVERAVWLESDTITVSGINASASISVAGGEYSVNGGAYTNTAGTLSNGAKVKVRHLTATAFSGTVKTTLTIGGVSGIFTSTTRTNGGNTPPVAENGTLVVAEGVQRDVILWASDADGDTLTYAVTGNPAHGTLGALSGNTLTYTPTAGYVGADSLTFSVTDSKGSVASATVVLSVETLAITDPNLLACVQTQLGIGTNLPTKAQLAGLTNLNCYDSNKKIGTAGVKELGRLTNLTFLFFYGADDLTALSPLVGLSKLTSFGLSYSSVTDIRPLGKLVNLTALYLYSNSKLTDLGSLATLSKLTSFRLYYSQVMDIAPVSKLANLTSLTLYGNSQLTDLSPITSLSKLTNFGLYESPVTDISPVGKLANLTSLYLHSKLTDLAPLVALSKLESFYLGYSSVTDLTPVGKLANLTSLSLVNNDKLTDLSSLAALSKLTSFGLSYSVVTDLTPVGKLANLSALYLGYNSKLTDLSPVGKLANLTQLSVYYSLVSDVTPLANLGKLTSANLTSNQVTDVSALKGMTNSFSVDLDGNCVTDVSMLPANISVTLGTQKQGCVAADFKPDAFAFTDQTGVALSTAVESNTITVSGINVPAVVSVTGGEYRINGGTYTNATGGSVNKGDTVQVRHSSSATPNVKTDTVLSIGGVFGTFSSTTRSATTPDLFAFTNQTGVALSSTITSNEITVSGINAAAPISVTGGKYSVNGGAYTSTAGTVVNGDKVTVQHTASASYSTKTDTVLTIGGVSDTFSSTTLNDTVPDAFSFTDQTGVALSATITSNSITVSGINAAATISVSGGKYSINGGTYTSIAGTVVSGDKVMVQHTSSATYYTKTDTLLTIGGVFDTFTSTTKVNTPPTAKVDNVTLDEDTLKTVTLVGTDPEGGTLTYAIVDQPQNGKWSLIGNTVTYTPNLNFNGKDSFTFKVNDGNADSAAATVSIQVNAVNDAPIAKDQTLSTTIGKALNIVLDGTDIDGDTLTYNITQTAANGTVTGSGNKVTYIPKAGWSGVEVIKFTVSDGKVVSPPATVNVTVTSDCAADNEPDNTSDKAVSAGLNSSTKRAICPESDVDWMKFTLSTSSSLRLETSGANGYDTRMWLFDSTLDSGKAKYSDDDGEGYYSKLTFDCTTPLPAGTYYIKVDEYGQDGKIPEYILHVQDVKSCVVDPPKTDLSVSVANPVMITPDMLTTHTLTVINQGEADAHGVVVTVKTPADKSRTEPVAYQQTQGTVDCPLSTTEPVAASCADVPLGDAVFRLGTLKRGEMATVRVTNRYFGYVVGDVLHMSASVVSTTADTDTSNNATTKPFTLRMKKIWQGCDYEGMVSTSTGAASSAEFRALLHEPTATPTLTLFNANAAASPAILLGNGSRWFGTNQDGSYPDGLRAVTKAPAGMRHVGVSSNGGIYWSDNQLTWVAAAVPVFVPMHDVTYAKGRYTAVGDNGTILSSVDGINWQSVVSNTTVSLRFVDMGNNELIVGGQDVLLRSGDAKKWTLVSGTIQGLMSGAVWNGSQYLLFDAAGSRHLVASRITTVATALPFTPVIDAQAKVTNWYVIYWQDSEYMALTSSGILTSKDGRNWVTRNPSVKAPYAAQRFGDRVAVVGAYGTLLTGACAPLPTASNGFAEQTDMPRSTYVESNIMTVSGLSSATPVTVTGGYYRKNGGVYTTAKTTVVNGDTLQVRQKTSSSSATSVMATLTLGTTALPFKTTTLTVDTSPDTFGFAPLTNVATSTWVESEPMVITGINVPVNISVSGGSGQYRLNGKEYTSTAASSAVKAGDVVQVRHLSSSLAKRTVTTTLTVGTAKPQFKTTTQ